MTAAIQTDPALEARMGRSDIYLHPEDYDHVIRVQLEGFLRPGSIVVETDAWKLWAWMGRTWRRKREAGIPRVGFRRKIPYSRLRPEAIIVARGGIVVRAYVDGGEVVRTLDYHDAVDAGRAAELTGDDRLLYREGVVRPSTMPDGSLEPYESLLRRAEARVRELNGGRG